MVHSLYMEDSRPDISIAILCYKEGEQVPIFTKRMKDSLQARGLSYEIILIGNYFPGQEKTDPTPGIIQSLAKADSTIVPITKIKEGMFGWDVRCGLDIAKGKTVAFIDGDGQMPAEDVVRVYDALLENHADMAQTFRVKRFDGMERIMISRIYNFLLKILFPSVSIYDGNAKPKIFTRDALSKLHLTADDWFIDAEIVIQAARLRFRVAQIPTVFRRLEHRTSFVKLSAVSIFLKKLIVYRLRRRP